VNGRIAAVARAGRGAAGPVTRRRSGAACASHVRAVGGSSFELGLLGVGIESLTVPTKIPPKLTLLLAGTPQLLATSGQRSVLQRRDAAILAYLAIAGPTSRARLLDLLWPDVQADAARSALRQRLFQMKRRVGFDLVVGDELLTLASDIATEPIATQGPSAPLLQGCDFDDCPMFERWLADQRLLRDTSRREALIIQAEHAEHEGRLADAIRAADQLIAANPVSEHVHRRLMRLHYLRGDRAAAVAAFERCEQQLKDELGVVPGAETMALLKVIEGVEQPTPDAPRRPLPPTILRPPRTIGRAHEMERMARAAESGHAFLLMGEAGMGKTRLMTEWADNHHGTLHVQARPGDSAISYALLARLIRALLQAAPLSLDDALRDDLAVALPEFPLGQRKSATGGIRAMQRGLATLLERATAMGVETVLLDDIHFADDASVDCVRELLTSDAAAGLQFGLAQRSAEDAPALQALRNVLLEHGKLELVTLAALDTAQMIEFLESLNLPGVDANALGPQLLRHSGGNPLFALETLKQIVRDGHEAKLPNPATVHQLIERRLRQLSTRAVAIARAAAIAGSDFSMQLAEVLLGASTLELADAWQELESAQFFSGDSFAHDIVYEVALSIVPDAVARRLHARIAAHLELHGGTIERIAYHWCEAREGHRAVPALRAAAELALQKFQRPAALRYLEQAVQFLQDLGLMSEAFPLQLAAVELLQGQDSGTRHEAALSRLQQLARTPAEHVRAGIALAILRHIQGRYADALSALQACEPLAEPGSREYSELWNVRGIALRGLGQVELAIEAHRAALVVARGSDDARNLPGCLNNLALALLEADDPGQAARAFEESASLEPDIMTRARVLNNLGIAQEESGDPQAAIETRENALALLRGQDGSEFARANVLISMAGNARSLYRYGDAIALLDQAQLVGLPSSHWRTSNLHCHRAATWIDLGEFEEADSEIERANSTATNSGAQADVLLVRAYYLLARGANARQVLSRCEELLSKRSDRRAIRQCRYRTTAALEPHEARELAARELEREAVHGNGAAQVPFATALARAHLALGDVQAALSAARRAVETMRTAKPLLISTLEVRYVLSQALRAAGEPEADELITQLGSELESIAEAHVPAKFRHSFLRRVRLNRQLLQAAAGVRNGAAHGSRPQGGTSEMPR